MEEKKNQQELEKRLKMGGLIGIKFTEEEKEAFFKEHANHVGEFIEDYMRWKLQSLQAAHCKIRGSSVEGGSSNLTDNAVYNSNSKSVSLAYA